jgi:hypothetical protein
MKKSLPMFLVEGNNPWWEQNKGPRQGVVNLSYGFEECLHPWMPIQINHKVIHELKQLKIVQK